MTVLDLVDAVSLSADITVVYGLTVDNAKACKFSPFAHTEHASLDKFS